MSGAQSAQAKGLAPPERTRDPKPLVITVLNSTS